MPTVTAQGHYWILTIPAHAYTPFLPPQLLYVKGQLELSNDTGFLHWQLVAYFAKKSRLAAVTSLFGSYHAELTKSDAALNYVWKLDTQVVGTQFELGRRPACRGTKHDWDAFWESAATGNIMDIPADIRIRQYNAIKRIRKDFATPLPRTCTTVVYCGPTGTGKSHDAWAAAGMDAYAKDPRTKFWDGYRGQMTVVIDEFRGAIDIAHILRWLDQYPTLVEEKGGAVPLCATRFFITSNLHPSKWYPDLDDATTAALLRRFTVEHKLIKYSV